MPLRGAAHFSHEYYARCKCGQLYFVWETNEGKRCQPSSNDEIKTHHTLDECDKCKEDTQ
jgi:hypothetical protein